VTPDRRSLIPALIVDVAFVVVFAAIGRATHDGDVLGPGGSGLATTAWPFVVGLLLGWIVCLGGQRPAAPLRTGLPVWAVTLVAGMVLRALSGQGIAVAFVIVAGITLLLFLVGWRAIAMLVARVRVSRSA
jgi:hypothetical protein